MQKSLTTLRIANSGLFIFVQLFLQFFRKSLLKKLLENETRSSTEMFDGQLLLVHAYRSLRPSGRATCVYVNVCVRAGRERTTFVLLRRILEPAHARTAAPCAPVWPKGSGWTTLPPHHSFVHAPSRPSPPSSSIILSISSQFFSSRCRVSIDNSWGNHDALCRSASFPKLGPRSRPDVDTTRGQAIWRWFAISKTRGWRNSENKIRTRPSADLRKCRRLNTYFFFLYRANIYFQPRRDAIDGKFICIRRTKQDGPFYSCPNGRS